MADIRTGQPLITAPVTAVVVFLLGLNLRPAVTSMGSALQEVSAAPGMTAAIAAVLVALPLWAIGAGGWITPWLRAQWGTHRTVTCALSVLVCSLIARVLGGPATLLSGTALACLAIAVIGTVLPTLVQSATPGAAGRLSAIYTLALGGGSTAGALITPPVVNSMSWQLGLAVWAVLAMVTVRLWQRTRGMGVPAAKPIALSPRTLFRSTTARALTLYFGLISTVTFLVMGWFPVILRDAGVSATMAGGCLALAMAMGLPMMWKVPLWAHGKGNQPALVLLLALPNVVGVTGLLVAPSFLPWLWALGLGLGMGSLALALTGIGMRAGHDAEVTTALSAMVQGLGYVIAGIGALVCGLLHSITGSWILPLTVVLLILGGQMISGMLAVRLVVVRPNLADTPEPEIPAQRTPAE